MSQLNAAALARLPAAIARPAFDPAHLKSGIVHLGIGAFHRAHQALYTDTVLAAGDRRWSITGVSLRSPQTRDALAPQHGLYTAAMRDADAEELRVVGSIGSVLVAPEDPDAVLSALCHPSTRIVSLTITEKGYCHSPATGELDEAHAEIVMSHGARPRGDVHAFNAHEVIQNLGPTIVMPGQKR